MKWLLWREYRLNLLILGVAAFLLVVPYAIALIAVCVVRMNPPRYVAPWAMALGGAACYSVILNQLTFALLGGNAFAGERADGSAEFMAYLPVSRGRRVVSKLILVLITGLVIWGFNAAVVALSWSHLDHRETEHAVVACCFVAITGLAFYCVGWLASSIQPTPTFAVAAALIAPFLLVLTLQFFAWWLSWEGLGQRGVAVGYAIGCVLMALVSFPIGTGYYLGRIEP